MTRVLTLPELRKKAMSVLVRELGYADAMRFMMLGRGDYTRERQQLLPKMSIRRLAARGDAIAAEEVGAKKTRKSKPSKPKRKQAA